MMPIRLILALSAICLLALPTSLGCRSAPSGPVRPELRTYAQHVQRMKRLALPSGEFAYVDEGEGPTVVLVHGIPTSSWMYRHVIADLVRMGYRVIAPDLLGMGASDRPKDMSATDVPRQAEHLVALLLDELGLKSWIHVVHDFGGPITWELLEDERVNIDRLVILDTFAFEEGWSPDLNAFTLNAMRLGVKAPFEAGFYRLTVEGMVEGSGFATDAMLGGYCKPLVDGAGDTYVHLYASTADLHGELARYQRTLASRRGLDTRIVWGAEDAFLSAKEQLPQFARLLGVPQANVRVLPGVGHLVAEEAPAAVVQAITE